MNRLVALALLLALALAPSEAQARRRQRPRQEKRETPAAPVEQRRRLLDLNADVLAPGEQQINVFWGQYSIGVVRGLQLSAHVAPWLLSLLNARAKYRLLDRDELRLSVEGSVWWLAAEEDLGMRVMSFPVDVRSTVALSENWEATVSWGFRWLMFETADGAQNSRSLFVETALARYDGRGAWMLLGKVPLFSNQTMQVAELLGKTDVSGSLTLDDLPAWSVMLARDQLLFKTAHLRFGAGYRNRPGIVLIESFGNLMLTADLYWRWK